MGWSYRKSINLGPLRINLSKRGVGYSVGAGGVRIGQNARGQRYVTAGAGGVLYRKTLGTAPVAPTPRLPHPPAPPPPAQRSAPVPAPAPLPGGTMQGTGPSGPSQPLTSSAIAQLVEDAQRLPRVDIIVTVCFTVIIMVVGWTLAAWWCLALLPLAGWAMHRWECRRRTVTFHLADSSPAIAHRFTHIQAAVRQLTTVDMVAALMGPDGQPAQPGPGNLEASHRLTGIELTDCEPPWVQSDADPLNLRCESWHLSCLPTGPLLVWRNGATWYAPWNEVRLAIHPYRLTSAAPPLDAIAVATTTPGQSTAMRTVQVAVVIVTMGTTSIPMLVSQPAVAHQMVTDWQIAISKPIP